VAFAGPYRGYGRIVIIARAGGWTSLITGLARTDVAVGATLVARPPLASPAATSHARAAQRREPVNPLHFVG
jgi:septal ring factor EnvC (AmiA/AmiB activator)